MELSPALLKELAGITADELERKAGDKRGSSRLHVARRAVLLRKTGQANVTIREVSSKGIGLVCSEAMQKDDEFIVSIPRSKEPAVLLKCKVVRCQGRGAGSNVFIVGATLVELIQKSDNPGAAANMDDERVQRAFRASP